MMKNNLAMKFWLSLARNAEGEGGGGGGGDGSPAPAGEGAGDVAGDTPAPAATFLSEAAKAAGEAKPGEGETKTVEGEAKPEGEGEQKEAPAELDLASIKLPEGVELAEEALKGFADILKNGELSPQERGQQLVDLHVQALTDVIKHTQEALVQANMNEWTKMNDQWRDEIKALPEYSKDPDGEAGKVLQALLAVGADEKFFQAMDLTGAGNNPAVMQVLHRLAKPFIEGGAVGGGETKTSGKQLGANIYTSTTKPQE